MLPLLLPRSSNPDFFRLADADFVGDPANCPADAAGGGGARRLLGEEAQFDAADFWAHAAWWLAASTLAAGALAAAFLALVRHHAPALARATIAFQMAVPATAAVALALSGAGGQALVAAALAALSWVVFYWWRAELAVATQLLQVAGHGLAENAQLFLLTLALGAAAALAAAPQLVGALAALSLGALVPNPEIPPGELCAAGGDVACCAWRPAGAGLAGVAASLTAAAWVFLTLQQVRVFTVAGSIAQW